MQELLCNILPYLGVQPQYNEKELEMDEVKKAEVPSLTGLTVQEAKGELQKLHLICDVKGEGEAISRQFPMEGETVNTGTKVILYTD